MVLSLSHIPKHHYFGLFLKSQKILEVATNSAVAEATVCAACPCPTQDHPDRGDNLIANLLLRPVAVGFNYLFILMTEICSHQLVFHDISCSSTTVLCQLLDISSSFICFPHKKDYPPLLSRHFAFGRTLQVEWSAEARYVREQLGHSRLWKFWDVKIYGK